MPPIITREQIAALPPEFRALLQPVIDYYERRLFALEAELAAAKKTPRNSSLPPSSEHPHAKPAPRRESSGKKPRVPQGQAGPRLVALTALLMGCFRQSKRRVALFLEYVLNQPCSPGWVVKLEQQATDALILPYQELVQQLPTEPVLGVDESPTKEGKNKAWLWTIVAATYTVFALRTTPAATVVQELLTEMFDGVVNCDRAKMYWKTGRPQWCRAHLKRDFQALIDHPNGQVKRLGRDLLRRTNLLFRIGRVAATAQSPGGESCVSCTPSAAG